LKPVFGDLWCKSVKSGTLNHIKYNFDVLERDYLPEEKDLRREGHEINGTFTSQVVVCFPPKIE
jgi:hypothetical protein